MSEVKRETAYKLSIKQIQESKYTYQEGWNPNYLLIGSTKISRVNVIALVVSKEDNLVKIDDGTGNVELRMFDEKQRNQSIEIGSPVLVIARPREFNESKYLVPEIIKKLDSKKWLELRAKELEKIDYGKQIEEEKPVEVEENKPKETSEPIAIVDKIKELDEGDGVPIEDLLSSLEMENADKYIDSLLNEGEIYEIKSGRLKVLN